ncbi:MAG: hypothetical protein AB7I19_06655 [Planctomycetota bacterium]
MRVCDRRSEPPVLALALVVVILAALGSAEAACRETRFGSPAPLVVSLVRGDQISEAFARGSEGNDAAHPDLRVRREEGGASSRRPHALPPARAPTVLRAS